MANNKKITSLISLNLLRVTSSFAIFRAWWPDKLTSCFVSPWVTRDRFQSKVSRREKQRYVKSSSVRYILLKVKMCTFLFSSQCPFLKHSQIVLAFWCEKWISKKNFNVWYFWDLSAYFFGILVVENEENHYWLEEKTSDLSIHALLANWNVPKVGTSFPSCQVYSGETIFIVTTLSYHNEVLQRSSLATI